MSDAAPPPEVDPLSMRRAAVAIGLGVVNVVLALAALGVLAVKAGAPPTASTSQVTTPAPPPTASTSQVTTPAPPPTASILQVTTPAPPPTPATPAPPPTPAPSAARTPVPVITLAP